MKHSTIIVALLGMAVSVIFVVGCGSDTVADSGAVVARVDNAVLTVKDFKVLRQATFSNLQMGQPRPTDEQILDRWVGWQVMIAKAKLEGLDKDPEIRFQVLEAQASVYGAHLHKMLVDDQLPPPSEDDLREFYDKHIREYMAKNETVWVYVMIIKTQSAAAEAVGKLRVGEDFETVAEQYSEDYNKESGSNLGYRETKSFHADQQAAITGLNIGDISDPIAVESADGKSVKHYVIIKIMDRINAGEPLKYEGIHPNQLKQRLYAEMRMDAEQQAEEELLTELNIEKFPDRIPEPESGELIKGVRKP